MKYVLLIVMVSTSWLASRIPASGQHYQMNAQSINERFAYKDGSLYYGELKDGLPAGSGTVFYANGNLYSGGWKDHAPYGKGTMYWVDRKEALTAIWEASKPVQVLAINRSDQEQPIRAAAGSAQPVRIWAVVVGVGRYSHMPALKYADDDAYRFYSFLKSPQGGALPNDQITILIDEEATSINIFEAMRRTFEAADEDDMVLFYFSGHGLPQAFLPVDYDGQYNSLLHQDIKKLFESCKAKHKLLIADACHAGGTFTAKSPANTEPGYFYSALQSNTGGLALLLSSKSDELSLEDDQLRSGVFSHFLLSGLNGKADIDGNGLVTISELYYFVDQGVYRHTARSQTPILIGNFDRNMPLGSVRRGRVIGRTGF